MWSLHPAWAQEADRQAAFQELLWPVSLLLFFSFWDHPVSFIKHICHSSEMACHLHATEPMKAFVQNFSNSPRSPIYYPCMRTFPKGVGRRALLINSPILLKAILKISARSFWILFAQIMLQKIKVIIHVNFLVGIRGAAEGWQNTHSSSMLGSWVRTIINHPNPVGKMFHINTCIDCRFSSTSWLISPILQCYNLPRLVHSLGFALKMAS